MRDLCKALNLGSDSAVLLMSPHNMRYFSGFSGGEGYVVCRDSGGAIIVDSRYTGAALEEAYSGFEVLEYNADMPLKKLLNEVLGGTKTVIFEEDYVTVRSHRNLKRILGGVELIPMSDEINRQRMIKSEDELECIAKAEQIGVDAFNHVIKLIKPGVSEIEIAAELEYCMKKSGAAGTSFDTIVLSGERTALPHGVPSTRRVKDGDFVLMDFGCVYGGYCSDMTRTVAVGEIDDEKRRVYEIVKAAQRVGLETIRSGIRGREADKAARDVIENAGYGKYFGHSLGHGVGVEIHELPNLSPRSDIELCENMVVSCEPGIYILGSFGVRIEDLVCVKNGGIRNFTNLTRELIEL